mmetsp:Transcript_28413/g.50335  ORF Transcript_28413/g.50335 Transcript_28413/m.50335 type:complete len:229 (-) Transcript_28413:253-939(-)
MLKHESQRTTRFRWFYLVMTMLLVILATKSSSVSGFSTRLSTSTSSPARSTRLQETAEPTQAEYGKSLELPSTYATCGQCGTSYALQEQDLGNGNGRRLECSVCGHSWYQSPSRLMRLGDGFEMVELPERDLERIQLNIEEGKPPKYTGAMKLYVGNISFGCTEEDVWELFEGIGKVGEVSLVRDDQGRNRGFGFVTMREKADAERAMEELNGLEVKGRTLNVKESNN